MIRCIRSYDTLKKNDKKFNSNVTNKTSKLELISANQFTPHVKINSIQNNSKEIKQKRMILLAELVGVILGDGHISYDTKKHTYSVEIALYSKEPEYILYVVKLIRLSLNVEPTTYHRDSDNTSVVRIFSKEIIENLIKLGLKPGHKTKNQVSVPVWIKNDKNLMIACLRGLTDTDGSIYLSWNKIRIIFALVSILRMHLSRSSKILKPWLKL